MLHPPRPPVPFVAREAETAALERLVAQASSGRGGALLVHGEPGVGKTALVHHHLAASPGVRVLTCSGVELEHALDHAALQQLCAPVLDLRGGLPPPQRHALEGALGLDDAASPPLLVGLALVGLLSEASGERPVVCVVDDVQWVDRASLVALALAVRRVADERVAFVLTAHGPDPSPSLPRLPDLPLRGLDEPQARALLAAAHPAPIDPEVGDRIVREARGNPLALLELSRSDAAPHLVGAADGAPAGAVEEGYASRIRALSPRGRSFVTLAAAEPLGDPTLLARAAGLAGLGLDDARGAEDDGLLAIDGHVRFRHPLVRSAAYRLATPAQRRSAHAALAEATDAEVDPDRHAWHLASTRVGSDEPVAVRLERSAGRAQARGGLSTAAAFLGRAAELSARPGQATRRTLEAATAYQRAGEWDAAVTLVDRLRPGDLTGDQATEVALLRARVLFQQTQSAGSTRRLLALAGDLDADRAREVYLEGYSYARFVDRSSGGATATAEEIAAAAPVREPPRPTDLLLDALLAQATMDGGQAVPHMRRAVAAFRSAPAQDEAGFPLLEHVVQLAVDLLDEEAALLLADRQVDLARRHGALAVLASALKFQAVARQIVGRFADAELCCAEAAALDEVTRSAADPYGEVLLAAWCGDADRTRAGIASIESEVGPAAEVATCYALVVLHNGQGRYDLALDLALRSFEQDREGGYQVWGLLHELVEAASHALQPERAREALRVLLERTGASGTGYALGMGALARALLEPDVESAGTLFREAVDRLARTRARPHHARAMLVHGEWLRRHGRRAQARRELSAAHDLLDAMGAAGFAARAARELEATGLHPRRRSDGAPQDRLTAQELHIARRVAGGMTSKEVAAALFLSPRTVDAHLRNIFRKLGITSRRELRDVSL